MLRYARQNGKPFASALQYATEGLGVPFDELKATADKYRPMLEGLGILDDRRGHKPLPLGMGSSGWSCTLELLVGIMVYNKNMKYKSNNNVVYSCKYHVVWCPKYRRKVLVDGVDERLKEICHEVADELLFEIVEMEVMPDHVHMLVEVDPQFGIHRAVKRMKGRSSHDLRREFPWLRSRLPSLWTNSYFVSTVGGAPLEAVKRYIENQRNV